jgi:transcriptional regulator with XRE-family HTH domain
VESLGNKLKTTREKKNETYEDVSRKINVANRYLKALEAEDFSVFPGEVYALGFLKNYGEYLGIDSDELLSLYRAMKLQEQPVPVDQLLNPPRRKFPVKSVLAVAGVLVVLGFIAGGVYFVIHMPKPTPAPPKPRKTREYTMNESSLERRLSVGDSFIVPYNGNNYQFTLSNVGEAIIIAAPGGDIPFDLGQVVTVDSDNDGFAELRITAADFVKNKPDTGARLRFELDTTTPPVAAEAAQPAGAIPGLPSDAVAATVIFSSPTPYPFMLQVAFQGYCLFRWEILAERDRQGLHEDYFERNSEPLSIPAQNSGIRIGASNAAVAKIQAIGGGKIVPLELGSAGEVVVADVRWVKDDENRYRLVLVRLE